MSPTDYFLGIIAIITLILIIRNTYFLDSNKIKHLAYSKKCNGEELEVVINGKPARPVIYVGKPLPLTKDNELLGARLSSMIRLSGLNATIAGTLIKTDKNKLMKDLEAEIEKTRMAYEATNHVKFYEKLRYLEKLYSDIIKTTTPYAGATIIIIWLEEGEDESKAEALKTMLEVETGIKLKRINTGLANALLNVENYAGHSILPYMILEDYNDDTIVLGYHPEFKITIGLTWPSEFETHIGILGPTGKGKTVAAFGILSQLVHLSISEKPSIVVIDPKGDLTRLIQQSGIEYNIMKSIEDVELFCAFGGVYVADRTYINDALGKSILSRLLECVSQQVFSRRIVVFIDEAWRYIEVAKKYMEESIREGRSRGLHLVYATQSPQDLPVRLVENTGVLLVFGGHTSSYLESIEMIGIKADDLAYLPVGIAYLKKGDKPPVKVKLHNFKEYIKNPTGSLQLQGSEG